MTFEEKKAYIFGASFILCFIIICVLPRCHIPQINKNKITKTQIELIEENLEKYRGDTGRYPTTEEGLNAFISNPGVTGWNGPYFKKANLPKDVWKNVRRAPGRASVGLPFRRIQHALLLHVRPGMGRNAEALLRLSPQVQHSESGLDHRVLDTRDGPVHHVLQLDPLALRGRKVRGQSLGRCDTRMADVVAPACGEL